MKRKWARIAILSGVAVFLTGWLMGVLARPTTATAPMVEVLHQDISAPVRAPRANSNASVADNRKRPKENRPQAYLNHLSEPPILGEACGAGELLPAWALCLYGGVYWVDAAGRPTPQSGVPVTVAFNGGVVTGTTFVHPGQVTPTYGLDISSLEPLFLEPVTVTTKVNGVSISRQVVFYPDFFNQSQQFDLFIPAVGALDSAQVWGMVVDFAAGGPVTDAVVLVEHYSQSLPVTTTFQMSQTEPIFSLTAADLAAIGAGPGSLITLTAQFGGDSDREVILLANDPVQINFVTSWKCDEFDPIPREGGPGGVPREGGPGGVPDVACFWGYGLVDGIPIAGVQVQMVISDTVYEAQTHLYSGETLPQYNISIWNGQAISGSVISATSSYNGIAASRFFTASLNDNLAQHIDLPLSGASVIANFLNAASVRDVVWHDGSVWVATNGGVIHWNPSDGSYTQLTTADGLINNDVYSIAIGNDDSLWFGTNSYMGTSCAALIHGGGVSHYTPGGNPEWETFSQLDGLTAGSIRAIEVGSDDSLWFGGGPCGVSHYTPGANPEWEVITNGILDSNVSDIIMTSDGSLWISTFYGVAHYTPGGTPEWETITSTHTTAIAVSSDDSLWFGHNGRASHYSPGGTPEWETFPMIPINDIAVGQDDSVWFGLRYNTGLVHYTPGGTPEWITYTTSNGLINNEIVAIAIGADNSHWFGTPSGLSRYIENGIPSEWTSFVPNTTLPSNSIEDILVMQDGSVWFAHGGSPCFGASHYTSGGTPAWQYYTSTVVGLGCIDEMAVEANQTIWFGGVDGVTRYMPGGSPEWQTFTVADGLVNSIVRDVVVGNDNSLWIATDGGVSHFTPGGNPEWVTYTVATTSGGLPDDRVMSIALSRDDDSMWFGTRGGAGHYMPGNNPGWETFTVTDGLVDNWVESIAADLNGSIWFGAVTGANNKGVARYTPGGNPEWEQFGGRHQLAENNVRAITVDADGSIWFGHNGAILHDPFGHIFGGISHYIPGGNPEWESFTTRDGLVGNGGVYEITIAPNGLLWIGTGNGVSNFLAPHQRSDLTLQLIEPDTVLPSQDLAYLLIVTNQSIRDADSTALTLTLPVSTTFVSASPIPSNTLPLMWNLGTLNSGNSITLVVTTTIDAGVTPDTILSAIALASTSSPEAFLSNNVATAETYVRDPDRADTRLSLVGPPLLPPGGTVNYMVQIDNVGGLIATDTVAFIAPPPELGFISTNPPPDGFPPLSWNLGNLPPLVPPIPIVMTLTVDSNVQPGVALAVSAQVTTTAPDSNPLNNHTTITVSTALTNAHTLILVAPNRLSNRYGASPALAQIYRLAIHPQVQGAVLDVERDPAVAAAYAAWDFNPGSWQAANDVARAIKALIDQYTLTYPNLAYLVFVGGDDIIPFYRVVDQNATMWHERNYAAYAPPGVVRAALNSDRMLTDDFYAARTPLPPNSPFWTDGHPLYLPDFATGRLVETPDEILAVINAFLTNNGRIALAPAVVGTLPQLTSDLGQAQCSALQADGVSASCTENGSVLRNEVLAQTTGSLWATIHSNHASMGPLTASDIGARSSSYDQSLLATFGCHAGLNTPDAAGASNDYDLVQAFLGQGGTYIGSTAYAYASYLSLGYSEALAAELTDQLLITSTQTLGAALVRAKHHYYTTRAGWFDYLDEKVLLPTTLYGLPMLQVTTPDTLLHTAADQASAGNALARGTRNGRTVVTVSLDNLSYTWHQDANGIYYDYQGQTLAQELLPVQPAWQIPLTGTGETPRGALLKVADYTAETPFDPVIAQSWALGQPLRQPLVEPSVTISGWDRALPFTLGSFVALPGAFEDVASLNLALGLFNGETQTELLIEGMILEVLYSDDDDRTAPDIRLARGVDFEQETALQVTATDDAAVTEVWGVCDDGHGRWQTVPLSQTGTGSWAGRCGWLASRFFVQAVDTAGNVTTSAWRTPTDADTLYLPVILK